MINEFYYYAIYKPYNVISQFSKENEQDLTLKDLFSVPSDVYPIGRLDKDSEGLLLLSNDSGLNEQLLHPSNKVTKTYLAQIEGVPSEESVLRLKKGIAIVIHKKTHQTLPASVFVIDEPFQIPIRNPPIRFRKNIPTSWLKIEIKEGKNRQVRKMCAAVGLPVLRLIRISMGKYTLPVLENGWIRKIMKSEII